MGYASWDDSFGKISLSPKNYAVSAYLSQHCSTINDMTYNDKSQHPSVSEKDVGLVLDNGRMYLQFKKRDFIVSNDEVRIDISTEDGEHLRWCLQDALFDEALCASMRDPDDHGDDKKTFGPF